VRWRIEKSFDELKNKPYETKAWDKSLNAKKMQAAFIVLAYNLSQLLNREIEGNTPDGKPQDKANGKKIVKRFDELEKKGNARGDSLPQLRKIFQESSQLSVKFYRWLRKHLHDPAPWEHARSRLATLYANC